MLFVARVRNFQNLAGELRAVVPAVGFRQRKTVGTPNGIERNRD
ncbi:hypothetical protein SBV1_1450025 [Verrucomicrobia bacterium]|nr:hypothetical protein SBV1_1450025 [Verrucomicrobiota bacterium]